MTQYRDRLIQLYAVNKVRNIGAVPAFRQLCAEFSGNLYFNAERNLIEDVKSEVENYLDPPDLTQEEPVRYAGNLTQQESVRNAVDLLIRNRRDSKHDLFYNVISFGYKANWTEAQQAYFDMV